MVILGPIDRLLGRVVGAGFGLKDLFTVVNLLGGVVSMGLAVLGHLWWASFAVMLGYLGDVLDGPVARLTGRGNRFGQEFDNIADHTSQCVAPAVVVFLYYKDVHLLLAFGLSAALVVAGAIRHARGAAAHFDFDLAWHGMPRPVAAFLVLAFLNSNLCLSLPEGRYVGIGLIALVTVLNLSPLPFTNHHGRRLQAWVVISIVLAFLIAIVTSIFWTHWFWDVALLDTVVYSLISWTAMSREELRAFFDASRRFRAELAGVVSSAPVSSAPTPPTPTPPTPTASRRTGFSNGEETP